MRDVYINKIAVFLPNQPVSNEEMEDYIGLIGGKSTRVRSIVLKLKTNVLRKILLGVILVFLPTLSNAQDTKVSLCLKDSLGQSVVGTSCSVLMQKKMSLFFLHGVMRMEKSHFSYLAMIVTY